jgi:hypothetical protein
VLVLRLLLRRRRWRRGVLLAVLRLLLLLRRWRLLLGSLRMFPLWLPVLLCGGVHLLLCAAATVRCRRRCCCCR